MTLRLGRDTSFGPIAQSYKCHFAGSGPQELPQKAGKSPISGDGGAVPRAGGDAARRGRPQHVRRQCRSTLSAAEAGEAAYPARAAVYGSRSSTLQAFSSPKAAASAFRALHECGTPSVRAALVTVMQSLRALRAMRLVVHGSDTRSPLQLCTLRLTRESPRGSTASPPDLWWTRINVWAVSVLLVDLYSVT